MKNEQMCTVLNYYFLSVFTKKDVENVSIQQQMFHGKQNYKLLDIIIKKNMVQTKLEALNSNKSQVVDEIHPRLLKELSSVIAEPLAKLFQNSLVQGVVPKDWREANITALFKKGCKSASQNYRPVSLTLWTPGIFFPNSCRRQINFSHVTARHRINFRQTSPLAPDYFSSPKNVATPRELSYL